MRFDCGETWPERHRRLSNWHRFFCLLPRKVADHDCRWLEYVERQGEYWDGWEWEFRPIQENT